MRYEDHEESPEECFEQFFEMLVEEAVKISKKDLESSEKISFFRDCRVDGCDLQVELVIELKD